MSRILKKIANSPKLIVILFLGNVLLASLLFMYLEGVVFQDAIWWSVITVSTVGYGDISPMTGGGQILGIVYVLINFLLLGPLIIATILLRLIEDRNEFTHAEQESIKNSIKEINEKLNQSV